VHSQVGPLEFHGFERIAHDQGTRRARGELGYPKPGEVVVGNLHGAPISEQFLTYSPADAMGLAPDCAMQIVLAGNEELFDNRTVISAYDSFKGTKKNMVVIPDITHYGIYGTSQLQAHRLALEWFEKHLKP
jgi:uncharacterized protein